MSRRALDWAWKCPINRSSDKLLLVRLGDVADGNNICSPSRDDLASDTAMDIKTVRAGLRRLQDDGYIIATAERYGGTKRVTGWRLILPKTEGLTLPKTEGLNPTKNGYISENGVVSILRPKPPTSDEKCDQKRSHSLGVLVPEVQKNKERKKERVLRTLVPPGKTKEDPDFERFWAIYPRKDAKLDARKAWTAATKLASADEIIEGLRSYPFSGEARYQKLPAGWLRDGRWMKVVHDTPPPPIEDERQRAIAEWNNMLR